MSAAPGCTCQKPEPETCQVRPAASSVSRCGPSAKVAPSRVVTSRSCSPVEDTIDSTTRASGHSVSVTAGRDGWAIRQSSTATTSCERCLRRPGDPAGATAHCTRVRQSSPSSGSPGPTLSTVTSTSSPASRCSCSATTAALSLRWAGSATCWKSQPPHRSGPANGHGGVTRSSEASSTSTASARRNRSPSWPSVTSTTTRSPGSACRTKTTTPSCRATTKPPCAIRSARTSYLSPTSDRPRTLRARWPPPGVGAQCRSPSRSFGGGTWVSACGPSGRGARRRPAPG